MLKINYGEKLIARYVQTKLKNKTELCGFSPQANYTDGVTAACRWSQCQLLLREGDAWSAHRIPTAVSPVPRPGAVTFPFKQLLS
jgi:hypothetical protein